MNTIDAGTLGLLRRYVTGFIEALANREIPLPSRGDCWYCSLDSSFRFRSDEHKPSVTLGETTKNTVHLISHLEERYYVPSLLIRALEVFPVTKPAQDYMRTMMVAASGRKRGLPGSIAKEMASFQEAAIKELEESLRNFILKLI